MTRKIYATDDNIATVILRLVLDRKREHYLHKPLPLEAVRVSGLTHGRQFVPDTWVTLFPFRGGSDAFGYG